MKRQKSDMTLSCAISGCKHLTRTLTTTCGKMTLAIGRPWSWCDIRVPDWQSWAIQQGKTPCLPFAGGIQFLCERVGTDMLTPAMPTIRRMLCEGQSDAVPGHHWEASPSLGGDSWEGRISHNCALHLHGRVTVHCTGPFHVTQWQRISVF